MVRGLSQHVSTTFERAREACSRGGYKVIAVRPDGVILSKRAFGQTHTRYFATDSKAGAL